jgi:hypothetical protein
MAVERVKLNSRGMRALLRSPEMLADLERRAARIATAAGPGHEVEGSIGRNRARAAVITATAEARIAEAKRRTLTRAIDAGR